MSDDWESMADSGVTGTDLQPQKFEEEKGPISLEKPEDKVKQTTQPKNAEKVILPQPSLYSVRKPKRRDSKKLERRLTKEIKSLMRKEDL
jgi:hypothetical protein